MMRSFAITSRLSAETFHAVVEGSRSHGDVLRRARAGLRRETQLPALSPGFQPNLSFTGNGQDLSLFRYEERKLQHSASRWSLDHPTAGIRIEPHPVRPSQVEHLGASSAM
jgi:hypothetical protein